MTVLNTSSAIITAGGTSKTFTFGFTPAAGSVLLVQVTAAATCATPSGWTVLGSLISSQGYYWFTKTSAGNETSFAITQNGDRPVIAGAWEFPSGYTLSLPQPFSASTTDSISMSGAGTLITGRFGQRSQNAQQDLTWVGNGAEDYDKFVWSPSDGQSTWASVYRTEEGGDGIKSWAVSNIPPSGEVLASTVVAYAPAVLASVTAKVSDGTSWRDVPAALAATHNDLTGRSAADAHPQSAITGLTASLAAKADLVGGAIPTNQLPPLAVNDTFVAANQAGMLALTAQIGDLCIRTDQSKTFILAAEPASTLSNWKEMLASGQVSSVNGQTGAVNLTAANLGALDQAAADTRYVNSDGDTVTGNLNVLGDTTMNWSSHTYGADMGGFKVTGLANGTVATDAVNKGQLDSVATAAANALLPTEVIGGTNVTVDTTTTPGSAIINATGGGAMVGVPTFIQDTQPTAGELGGATKYIWHQTAGGTIVSTWIESGA